MDRKRSGALLTIIVVGIILGALGSLGGVCAVAGQLGESSLRGFQRAMVEMSSGGNPELAERQLAMQDRANAVAAEWRVPSVIYQVLNLIASAALLMGALRIRSWQAEGPMLFSAAALASSVVDIAGGVLGLLVQRETAAIMQEHMADITSADPNMPASAGRAMGAMTDASMSVGICFAIAWVLLKVGFYVFGVLYLRKPEVRAQFAPAATA